MLDQYGRKIDYLRVSVTDRCNLRCRYCMPEEGIQLLNRGDILSFEEITEVVRTAVDMGVTKVRLTGGEPLVRRGIVNLVGSIAEIQGLEDLTMTTNGILLSQYAKELIKVWVPAEMVSTATDGDFEFRIVRLRLAQV